MAVASDIKPASSLLPNKKSIDETVANSRYPNAKTLLISSKRPRSFLERTARELLAGGTDTIVLSALGEAIPLCIQLESSLQRKNVVTRVQVETVFHTSSARASKTPGLRITVQKHPGFKGSRISPNFVSFAELPANEFTPPYETTTTEYMISVNAGNEEFSVGGGGINRAFFNEFGRVLQDVSFYALLHQHAFQKAICENHGKSSDDVMPTIIEGGADFLSASHIKLILCRPYNFKNLNDPTYSAGTIFISVFKSAFPCSNPYNMGMAYVVAPKGCNYSNPHHFLEAVFTASANLMTTLCDYNGFVRRCTADKSKKYERISVCRVCLISGGLYKHPLVSKREIATCIIEGLASTYRHGPAPRLNFAYDDNLFMNVWAELTGRDILKNGKEV